MVAKIPYIFVASPVVVCWMLFAAEVPTVFPVIDTAVVGVEK